MSWWFGSLVATGEHARREIDDEPNDAEQVVRRVMDSPGLDGFQWKVWLVAGSGFFTTSYTIFSTNVIGPALAYVYNGESYSSTSANATGFNSTSASANDSSCSTTTDPALIINLTTLGGIVVGMLSFGYLADRYGRKSVYGAELMIVIVATLGLTEATSGRGDYMNIYGWVGFFRFLLGIGIGAEYPLSAIIAAEWSSTRSRAKMMTAVFLMQSLGQVAAYALALLVLYVVTRANGLDPSEMDDRLKTEPVIDAYWRIVVGIGAIPALIAIGLRRLVPETPLWLAVHSHPAEATQAVGAVYPYSSDEELGNVHARHNGAGGRDGVDDDEERSSARKMFDYFAQARRYLAENDRWRALLGVCIVWFLLDVAFYGLGLDSPQTISSIWLSGQPNVTTIYDTCSQSWLTDLSRPNSTIYQMLSEDAVHNIITISTGTVTGSVIILLVINYVPRVTWMACWFVVLGGLFLVNGSTLFVAFESDKYALTITLFVLAQTMFNVGPNTITFILPAELFHTRYRGTMYGLAAASGKLGAIAIQVVLQESVQKQLARGSGGNELAGLLLGLCPAMLLGALVTWVWIPEVQYARSDHRTRGPNGHGRDDSDDDGDDASNDDDDDDDDDSSRGSGGGRGHGEGGSVRQRPRVVQGSFRERLKLPSRPLEEIALYPSEGQVIGFRKNFARLWGKIGGKRRAGGVKRKRSRGGSNNGGDGDTGIDPSIRLRRAIYANDASLVKRILASHPRLLHNPDHSPFVSASSSGNSNLHLAALLGHVQICKQLVSQGHEADGPALNDQHQTALMLAAAAGHTEVVHFLCEHDPAVVLRQDNRLRDAVMEASLGGHDTVLQILLTYAPGGAARAVAQADMDGNTALHFASSNGNLLVLRTLLAAGADAGRENAWSWTAEAYSATVQAEVYLKNLVAEVERRKQARREAEGSRKGGAVRIVEDGDS